MRPAFVKGLDRRGTPGHINEILGLTDIEKKQMCLDLLEEFGAQNITVRGDEIHHSCILPFGLHRNGDANPSASLNWSKLTYGCFGCGNSGGLYWFINVCRGDNTAGSRRTAKQWINDRIDRGGEDGLQDVLRYIDAVYAKETRDELQTIPRYSPLVLRPWELIHPYMTEIRHVPEANLVHHRVGYDPDLDRIVFPHFWMGNLVGWQTRRISNDGTPKYKSTTGFPKDSTIYNWKDGAVPLVLESPMSVVSKSHIGDVVNFVATFGASVTHHQMRALADAPRVVMWFDNDPAGWEATRTVGDFLVNYSDVYAVDNPYAADPADMDDDTVRTLIEGAIPYPVWQQPETLKGWDMGIIKHGHGEVIPEEGDDKKTAAANWSEKDAEELAEENADND